MMKMNHFKQQKKIHMSRMNDGHQFIFVDSTV